MTLRELLLELGTSGVVVRAINGRVGLTPRSWLNEPRSLAMTIHKPALLTILISGFQAVVHEAAYVFEERLGIADDLGLSTSIGSAAWLVAVGEAMHAEKSASHCKDVVSMACKIFGAVRATDVGCRRPWREFSASAAMHHSLESGVES
jgi:hypothetical protein